MPHEKGGAAAVLDAPTAPRKNVMEVFAEGAKSGMNLVLSNMAPNTVFAFCIVVALNITGLMPVIGRVFSPMMGIFGLPGEAATACVLAYVSTSGGIAAAIALISDGIMDARQCAIIFPYFMLVGAMLQYYGRILAPSGLSAKHHKVCLIISVADGLLAMLLMRFLLIFF